MLGVFYTMLQRVKKAFTLVELIVVVVVLGIIAALAIATFSTVRQEAASSVAERTAEGIARNANAIGAFNGGTTQADLATAYDEAIGTTATAAAAEFTVTISANGETGLACVSVADGVASSAPGAC
jgi:prepilin-type N-terminal cleavage/methylation domain-containing protein